MVIRIGLLPAVPLIASSTFAASSSVQMTAFISVAFSLYSMSLAIRRVVAGIGMAFSLIRASITSHHSGMLGSITSTLSPLPMPIFLIAPAPFEERDFSSLNENLFSTSPSVQKSAAASPHLSKTSRGNENLLGTESENSAYSLLYSFMLGIAPLSADRTARLKEGTIPPQSSSNSPL